MMHTVAMFGKRSPGELKVYTAQSLADALAERAPGWSAQQVPLNAVVAMLPIPRSELHRGPKVLAPLGWESYPSQLHFASLEVA